MAPYALGCVELSSRRSSLAEHLGDVPIAHGLLCKRKGAVLSHLASGPEERSKGGARQRAADAHPPDAERAVPMLCNRHLPEEASGRRLKNYDAFWVGLNQGGGRDFHAETAPQS